MRSAATTSAVREAFFADEPASVFWAKHGGDDIEPALERLFGFGRDRRARLAAALRGDEFFEGAGDFFRLAVNCPRLRER